MSNSGQVRLKRPQKKGVNIVLLQELFATPYFCKVQAAKYFEPAEERDNSRLITVMSELAREQVAGVPALAILPNIHCLTQQIPV